jgi:glycosyltransferase involved in cell wall biosynthesis
MPKRERTVLHVLPHAGGGGDTYVDVLGDMRGYRFERLYVAPKRKPGLAQVATGLPDLRPLVRRHGLVHIHGEAAAGMLLPLLALRRSVVTLHGLHLLRRVTGVQHAAAALNLCAVLAAASRTICVSNAEHRQLASAVGAWAMQRALVVHNGVRIPAETSAAERISVREELDLDGAEPVAIWVGSLDERRDPLAVVRAAQRTSATLLVVGEGPLRNEVEQAATARTLLLGQRSDVPRLLAAADFFVLMSEREGFSFALLEAMAHGLPAIVADIPENVEAVGDSGLAVPYGDEQAIAAALERLAADRQERSALGARARQRITGHFAADEMIARTRAVYDDVVDSV